MGTFKELAGEVEQPRLSPVCWGSSLGPHKHPKKGGEVTELDYGQYENGVTSAGHCDRRFSGDRNHLKPHQQTRESAR